MRSANLAGPRRLCWRCGLDSVSTADRSISRCSKVSRASGVRTPTIRIIGVGRGGTSSRSREPVLRPAVDLEWQHLRRMAGQRSGSLHGPVRSGDREHGARHRQPQRPGNPVPGCGQHDEHPFGCTAAHARCIWLHIAVPLQVRGSCSRSVPADRRCPAGWHRVPGRRRPLLGAGASSSLVRGLGDAVPVARDAEALIARPGERTRSGRPRFTSEEGWPEEADRAAAEEELGAVPRPRRRASSRGARPTIRILPRHRRA